MNFTEAERLAASAALEVERRFGAAGYSDAKCRSETFRVSDTEFGIGVSVALNVEGQEWRQLLKAKYPVGERFAAQAADRLLYWISLKAPLTTS